MSENNNTGTVSLGNEPADEPARRLTIEDVANAAGVSVATVSRALRGLPNVTAATRQRVQDAADRLDYLPGSLAAGGNYHHIHHGVAARYLLEHRLTGAEGARYAVCPAETDGEKGVYDPYAGEEPLCGG